MALVDEIQAKAIEYWNDSNPDMIVEKIPSLVVDFVLEAFIDRCHFPSNYTKDKIQQIMSSYTNKMAMACVDIYAKAGTEGEKSHTENGVQRTYQNAWISESLYDGLPNYVSTI